MRKVTVTPFVQNLFSNVPVETGLTDAEILASTSAPIAPQTFSRHRVKLPARIPAQELSLLARLVQQHLGQDAATILAAVRNGTANRDCSAFACLCGTSVATSPKAMLSIERLTEQLAVSSKSIYLFDRADSLPYLSPASDDVLDDGAILTKSAWLDHPSTLLRYARKPRILGVLTQRSLGSRLQSHGDEGIEQLIDNLELCEHSLSIIEDSPRRAHRVFRGIFADAQAVAIFDRRVMIVYPQHHRTFRIYDAAESTTHATFIHEAIRGFHRLRRFRMHDPAASATIAYLKGHLTYTIPRR